MRYAFYIIVTLLINCIKKLLLRAIEFEIAGRITRNFRLKRMRMKFVVCNIINNLREDLKEYSSKENRTCLKP